MRVDSLLRNGTHVTDPRLDLLKPTDLRHQDRYPLSALPSAEIPTRVPCVVGWDWYEAFDRPVLVDGHWWIGYDGPNKLGRVRGGHCAALKPYGVRDSRAWWDYYNQGEEGACVGFGVSRVMTLLNRRRYDAFWLYRQAQRIDEWEGEGYEGTSVRAGLEIARLHGHRRMLNGKSYPATHRDGIDAYRWITDVSDVATVLGDASREYVDLLNSWGRMYPQVVRVPMSVVEVLLQRGNEIATVTDR